MKTFVVEFTWHGKPHTIHVLASRYFNAQMQVLDRFATADIWSVQELR